VTKPALIPTEGPMGRPKEVNGSRIKFFARIDLCPKFKTSSVTPGLVYFFYLLLVLLVSGRYCLDVSLFEKIQDYKEEDF
jgi:hypothetical protein